MPMNTAEWLEHANGRLAGEHFSIRLGRKTGTAELRLELDGRKKTVAREKNPDEIAAIRRLLVRALWRVRYR